MFCGAHQAAQRSASSRRCGCTLTAGRGSERFRPDIFVPIFLPKEKDNESILLSKKTSKKSGKEKSNDFPSWAKGQKPKSGENGKDFAKRLMDEQYGVGKWENKGMGQVQSIVKLKKHEIEIIKYGKSLFIVAYTFR